MKKQAIPLYLCKCCHREFSPLQPFPVGNQSVGSYLIESAYGNLPSLQLHRCNTLQRGIAELVGFVLQDVEDEILPPTVNGVE